ncbi:hypothetical protein AVEN_182613-1 [Araneus ventricosus]|uniref:Uncharacterized protein n=1 Tax=Araneus ventricosus TaxID=182803 RepID=A0A4Y2MSK6_ARAVE|nr:hypothetical protein AVEN_248698-1 [Araneus ventricosus]GBN28749.1 hypothetical protein AVEN_10160-1 [Araneus ventricosus]GBN28810.1 hypothetical protein AVEN_57756-1 [Araneus ventricosus]GBN28817.1 hypothetical protein AVEN_61519-1 [Araneus ventricosus]GBN28918.1 hypothetical protein AVEN_182613-1 [Araneus ventricosus]
MTLSTSTPHRNYPSNWIDCFMQFTHRQQCHLTATVSSLRMSDLLRLRCNYFICIHVDARTSRSPPLFLMQPINLKSVFSEKKVLVNCSSEPST